MTSRLFAELETFSWWTLSNILQLKNFLIDSEQSISPDTLTCATTAMFNNQLLTAFIVSLFVSKKIKENTTQRPIQWGWCPWFAPISTPTIPYEYRRLYWVYTIKNAYSETIILICMPLTFSSSFLYFWFCSVPCLYSFSTQHVEETVSPSWRLVLLKRCLPSLTGDCVMVVVFPLVFATPYNTKHLDCR